MRQIIEEDMHIHTTASDGEYSPLRMYEKVKETKQIKTFAITDHDTVRGAKEVLQHLKENPDKEINYIPGAEFNASIYPLKFKVQKSRLHILGYEFDLNNSVIRNIIKERKYIDHLAIEKQLYELKQMANISFPKTEINEIYQKNNFGRVDIAKLLMYHGYVSNINEAFDKYLVETHERVRETLPKIYDENVITAIKQAGGYVSLAHPSSLRLDLETLKQYIIYLKSLGLDSIEVYHPHQNSKYSRELHRMAKELELYVSGGSDYHGPIVKPKIHLGIDKRNGKNKTLTLAHKILNNRDNK